MRKVFQIIFCILSAISVVAAFLLGVYLDFPYAFIGVAAALVFLGLTLLCKYGIPFLHQEPKIDFLNSDETNREIREREAGNTTDAKELDDKK